MKRSRVDVTLTRRQWDLIHWALCASVDQHVKFLHHDEWDFKMDKKTKRHALKILKDLKNARDLFPEKSVIIK